MKSIILLLSTFFTILTAYAIDPITGPGTVCTGATIILSSTTGGGVWSTAVGTPGTIDASGVLTGISAGIVTVTYTVGGPYVTTDVTVTPTPMLTSPTTATICDSALFTYTPTASVPGATFSWSRPFVSGIAALGGSGIGAINEVLNSTISFPVTVAYIFTVTVGGCSSVQTVNVTVNPIPVLSSLTTTTACSGSLFNYYPASLTFGTTYQWARASVVGITPATSSGTGSVGEVLLNSTAGAVTVIYSYTLTAATCSQVQPVTVMVSLPPNSGTLSGADTLCEGATSTFTTTGSGGVWGGVTGKVSVLGSGIVTGMAAGPDTVRYSVTNGCGTYTSIKPVWVKSATECMSGVQATVREAPQVLIYPNPSQGIFIVEIRQSYGEEVAITVADVAGRCMQYFKMQTNSMRALDMRLAAAGTYVITTMTSTGAYRAKVVIVN